MRSRRVEVALGDALELLIDHRGRTPRKLGGDFSTCGVRVVSAKNVKDGRLVLNSDVRFVSREMHDRWMPNKLKPGDVLVTSEAPLGEVAYLKSDADFCLGQRLFALRPKSAVLDSRYLYYLLRTHEVSSQIRARATGTTAQGIRQAELVKVRLALPPVDEQRRIATILGALDDKIELNRRMSATVEACVRALFERQVASLRTDAPIGKLAGNLRRQVQPGEMAPDEPYVGLEHVPRGSLFLDRWGEAESVVSAKNRFGRGDILFGKLRPYFRKVSLAPTAGVCSTDILVIRPRHQSWRAFVLLSLANPAFIDAVSASAHGTRMPRTRWADIAASRVPFELAAAEAFEAAAAPLIGVLETHAAESRQLARTRDSLLPELFSRGRPCATGAPAERRPPNLRLSAQ